MKERPAISFLHLAVLITLGVAQPLFALVADNLGFLVAHKLVGIRLILWTATAGFGIAGVTWMVIRTLSFLSAPVGSYTYWALLFLLLGVSACYVLVHSTNFPLALIIALSLGVAAGILWLYGNFHWVREFFTFFAIFILVSPLLVLLEADNNEMLFSNSQDVASNITKKNIPIVIVVADELSLVDLMKDTDSINEQRFPEIARFSANSTWYRNATTVSETTLLALPAILTGKDPLKEKRKPPTWSNYPENLFTLLDSNYEMISVELATLMCPTEMCIQDYTGSASLKVIVEDSLIVYLHAVLPTELRRSLPALGAQWANFRAEIEPLNPDYKIAFRFDERISGFNKFMHAIETLPAMSLFFGHFLYPHAPWKHLPDNRNYSLIERSNYVYGVRQEGGSMSHEWYDNETLVKVAHQRHILQTGSFDRRFGAIVNSLKQSGKYENSMIILASDHGSSYIPGNSRREANEANLADIVSIPLMIKYPNQNQAIKDERHVTTVDIVPTIVDVIGLSTDQNFDGQSLVGETYDEADEIRIATDTGHRNYSFQSIDDSFERSLVRQLNRFGDGDFGELYRQNHQLLIDSRVNEHNLKHSLPEFELVLEGEHLYRDIDLDARYIPTLIRARLSNGAEDFRNTEIAVAVNGIIRAVTRLVSFEDVPFNLQAVVDPSSFVSGVNEISFHEIDRSSGEIQLGVSTAYRDNYSLRKQLTGVLVVNDTFRVLDDGRQGTATLRYVPEFEQLTINGWAFDMDRLSKADEVLIYKDYQLIARSLVSIRRSYLPEKVNSIDALYSGFDVRVPVTSAVLSGSRLDIIARFISAGETYHARLTQRPDSTVPMLEVDSFGTSKFSVLESSKKLLVPGYRYDFTDPNDTEMIAGVGWAKSANQIRWSVAGNASLVFKIASRTDVAISIETRALVDLNIPVTQKVIFTIDDCFQNEIHITRSGSHRIELQIPQQCLNNQLTQLKMHFPDAVSPFELGSGNDKRILALAVKWLEFQFEPEI